MTTPRELECRVCQAHADKLDTRPDLLVAGLAAEQSGVLSLDELRTCGLTREAVRVRVRNGRLHAMHRGVYAVGHVGLPVEGSWLAAVKACGSGAVLSHFSAGALWGFVTWDDRYPEVTVAGATARTHRGIRTHRTTALDHEDVTRHRGIPVTAPARTLIDLASMLPYTAIRRAVRQAQSQQRTHVQQLLRVRARLGPRRGWAKLARILATGPAPTRSELEDAVLDLLLRGGLAHPNVNVPLIIAGRRVIPDFRWPAQRLVIEADGAKWHDNLVAREDDAERQAALEAHGERVVRVTWAQAIARPAQTLARVRAAGAPPAAG